MRSVFGKVAVLALTSVVASAVVAGCSGQRDVDVASKKDEPTGKVSLNLEPVAGLVINEVTYTVTQGTTVVRTDVLPVPGSGGNFSFGINLPVGDGYSVSLEAESVPAGFTCTGGFGPFDVVANQSTPIGPLVLVCVDNTDGDIYVPVNVETEDCPRLIVEYAVATPHSAFVPDGTINVFAAATDADGRPVTYQWSVASPIGTFTSPTAANTVFNCDTAGNEVLITVTADNGQCDTALSTVISCVNQSCGDGALDPGEDCDPADASDPNAASCPADCTVHCGDNIVEYTETCEPPNTGLCNGLCQERVAACGDGFLTAPEACDPTASPTGAPAGSDCAADCTVVAGAVCGDGTVNGSEECEPINSPLCSDQCETVGTQACLDCENGGDCFEFVDNCNAYTGAGRTNCYDVVQCVQDTNCGDNPNQLAACFCGALSIADCNAAPLNGPGSPNGACKDLIVAGLAPVNTSSEVLGLFTATGRPAGGALARLNCQKIGSGGVCNSVCGFDSTTPFP